MKSKLYQIFLILIIALSGCGTLGSFGIYNISIDKNQLSKSIDLIYTNYPQYKIPEKWKLYDTWKERGYDFLDCRIFYFAVPPEEMFFVSLLSDNLSINKTSISIRAVCRGNPKWLLQEDFSKDEIERIELRFKKEILSKINYDY